MGGEKRVVFGKGWILFRFNYYGSKKFGGGEKMRLI